MRSRVRLWKRALAALVAASVVAAYLVSSTSCAAVINASPGLRWWLFSNFGAQRVCPEMLKTSLTLRMQEGAPGIGRFFPRSCNYSVNDDAQTLQVNVFGVGYGYVPPAKHVGFNLSVSVEYRPDFQIAGDDLYVWGKFSRLTGAPNFQIQYAENPVVDVATNVTPLGSGLNILGNQVVVGFLSRGFTVVDNSDSGKLFSLGILSPPSKPFQPYQVDDDSSYTFANEAVDVYVGSRDFLGPYEVTDSDQQLQLRMNVTGNPLEFMVVSKATGDAWLEQYNHGQAGPPPPPGAIMGAPLNQGPTLKRLTLPPGFYYVVVDNTTTAGMVNPPVSLIPNPLFDGSSRLTYVAQLIEP
ncbi:MAG: hypothetical protein U0414_08115 [Polyangiaceae bacterium]